MIIKIKRSWYACSLENEMCCCRKFSKKKKLEVSHYGFMRLMVIKYGVVF